MQVVDRDHGSQKRQTTFDDRGLLILQVLVLIVQVIDAQTVSVKEEGIGKGTVESGDR